MLVNVVESNIVNLCHTHSFKAFKEKPKKRSIKKSGIFRTYKMVEFRDQINARFRTSLRYDSFGDPTA